MYLNVTCMHTCIHHGDHDWWTLVTHVRSLEWVSELIMIWHVLSLRDVRSRWLTLLTAFRYTLIYTDWLHHGPARWSLMFHPRFYHVPGQTCMNDRSIYCCESHDLSNRNLHRLPGLHPVPRQATTTKQPKRCRLDAQKSPTRCFFCGVGGSLWRDMKGPCVRNVWPVWQFWVFNSIDVEWIISKSPLPTAFDMKKEECISKPTAGWLEPIESFHDSL